MRDLTFRRLRTVPAWSRLRLGGRNEQGAVAVLVSVLIGTGVLLGMGALVIDVGQIYQNRAELQNGADAAALAVAKTCVAGSCDPSVATKYADDNASKLTGHTAYVNLVCGSGTLGNCPASTGKITDCPDAPADANYVDVYTSTKMANGSHLLPPAFARTLVGNGNYKGTTVYACAQAEWGAPQSGHTIALTFSACTWDHATGQGTIQGPTYAPAPPYPPYPDASLDQVVHLHQGGSTSYGGCPTEPAGADAAGNFGWTDDSGNCSTTITGGTYGGSTGTSVSQDCQTALYNDWADQAKVLLPIYTKVTGTGTNVTYTLDGLAEFVITGYHMPGFEQKDYLTKSYPCTGDTFCISGVFTQGLIPPPPGGLGGKDLGAYTIKLTG